MILKINTKEFEAKVIYGKLQEAGEKFPHLYGKLTLENVVKVDIPNV